MGKYFYWENDKKKEKSADTRNRCIALHLRVIDLYRLCCFPFSSAIFSLCPRGFDWRTIHLAMRFFNTEKLLS